MSARFLLDTNTIIYIRKARPDSVRQAFGKLKAGDAAMSVITFGELIYGVSKSPRREEALGQLRRIAQIIPVLGLNEDVAHRYGVVRAELEAKGQMIGNNDLWIAAHALSEELTLVTNNEKEFRRVRGLKIQNWAS